MDTSVPDDDECEGQKKTYTKTVFVKFMHMILYAECYSFAVFAEDASSVRTVFHLLRFKSECNGWGMVLMKLTLEKYIPHLHTLKGLSTSQLLLYRTIFEQNSLLYEMCALTKIPIVCKVYLLCVDYVSCDKKCICIIVQV